MENEFNKLKEKFLSEISETKNLDYVRNFAKEIRKKINYKIEEYRETDGKFDEKLFYLDKEFFEKIFYYTYGINQEQDLKKLRKLYGILTCYLELNKEISYLTKDFKDSI